MPPFSFGPIYCETLSARAGMFPVELMNTISNGVIVLFGLAAVYLVAKRAPRAGDLYVLCGLLIATGIGSGLWHGLRDPSALFWEASSGLFFLFALALFWARRLWSIPGALLFLAAFYGGVVVSRQYWDGEFWGIHLQRWVALAPVVIVAGITLIARTYGYSKRAALYSTAALSLALIALVFRTVDLAACPYIPFGTHFLWHCFLSAGGFLGILALTEILPVKAIGRGAQPGVEAAE
jgi:hypothetical protein